MEQHFQAELRAAGSREFQGERDASRPGAGTTRRRPPGPHRGGPSTARPWCMRSKNSRTDSVSVSCAGAVQRSLDGTASGASRSDIAPLARHGAAVVASTPQPGTGTEKGEGEAIDGGASGQPVQNDQRVVAADQPSQPGRSIRHHRGWRFHGEVRGGRLGEPTVPTLPQGDPEDGPAVLFTQTQRHLHGQPALPHTTEAADHRETAVSGGQRTGDGVSVTESADERTEGVRWAEIEAAAGGLGSFGGVVQQGARDPVQLERVGEQVEGPPPRLSDAPGFDPMWRRAAGPCRFLRYACVRLLEISAGVLVRIANSQTKVALSRDVWSLAQAADHIGRRLPGLRSSAEAMTPVAGYAAFTNGLIRISDAGGAVRPPGVAGVSELRDVVCLWQARHDQLADEASVSCLEESVAEQLDKLTRPTGGAASGGRGELARGIEGLDRDEQIPPPLSALASIPRRPGREAGLTEGTSRGLRPRPAPARHDLRY